MIPLWTGAALAQAVGGEVRGTLPERISGISIDSRTLRKGDAFFAVKGERTDGHAYLAAAAEAGAALLVADKAKPADLPPLAAPLIAVENVLAALENLGKAARARLNPAAKVAAITGSVGKTTVKEMLAQVLARFGKVHYSPASFNNHFGVPLTLARMPQDTDFAVFEIGMSHAGEITPLAALARPHLALITRIAAAHMGHFNSLEEIAAAKAEIFSGLAPNGAILLNRDDGQYEFLAAKARAAGHSLLYGFGRSQAANYRLTDEKSLPQGGQEFVFVAAAQAQPVHLAAQGAHMAENACAVLAASALWQLDISKAAAALAQFQAGAGRGARHILALPHKAPLGAGTFLLIDESYNANPLSMRQALKLLAAADVKTGRRIAVLGDMLELGAAAQAEHEALAAEVTAAKADMLFLAGANMRFLADKLAKNTPHCAVRWQETAAGLAEKLEKTLQAGDALMIKGSNSVGLGAVVKTLLGEYPPLP